MAVQKTHLNKEQTNSLATKYPKIIVKSNGNSTNSGGIAFVQNKDLLNDLKWTHTELMPGRVSRLQVVIGDNNGLDIITPNNSTDKAEFYETLLRT